MLDKVNARAFGARVLTRERVFAGRFDSGLNDLHWMIVSIDLSCNAVRLLSRRDGSTLDPARRITRSAGITRVIVPC